MQIKNILSMLTIVAATSVSAQSNLYVKPMIGYGRSSVHFPGNSIKGTEISAYNAAIHVGIESSQWCFETGVRYFTTGWQHKNAFIARVDDPFGRLIPVDNIRSTYRHIGLPLAVQLNKRLSENLSILPSIQLMPAYNIGVAYSMSPRIYEKQLVSGNEFTSTFHRFSVFGGAAINLEYKISDNLTVTAGPAFQYMLTSLSQDYHMSGISYNNEQLNYAFTFDLGVKWSFKKNKIAETK